MTADIPNFSALKALVLHKSDRNCAALCDQLRRLKVTATVQWPPVCASGVEFDLVFFDVDQGFDAMFPWSTAKAPVPLVAIVGSETPGRLEWALSKRPAAHILKPIGSNGVFHSLFTAFSTHAEALRTQKKISDLQHRLKLRPMVLRVIMDLMLRRGLNDEEAFGLLRSASMRRQISIEEMSQRLADGDELDRQDLAMIAPSQPRDVPMPTLKAR